MPRWVDMRGQSSPIHCEFVRFKGFQTEREALFARRKWFKTCPSKSPGIPVNAEVHARTSTARRTLATRMNWHWRKYALGLCYGLLYRRTAKILRYNIYRIGACRLYFLQWTSVGTLDHSVGTLDHSVGTVGVSYVSGCRAYNSG